VLLYPFTAIVINISNYLFAKFFKVNIKAQKQVFSPIDIDLYLEDFTKHSSRDSDIKNEVQIFQNARDLPNIRIRECMIPRPEIVAIEDTDDMGELKNKFIDNGLSKVLVYAETIDNIIGYIHVYDMFKTPKNIKSALRPILIVPESMTADKLLEMFIKQNKNIAVVVDEFGGTSGMITIEDLIEEIFGEINDEYDTDELIEKKISDDEYIFSGRLEIDYINEKFNLNLPESDEYETLAGLIISYCESIPEKDSEINVLPFIFKIMEVSDTKIEQVNLKIKYN
jgi:CBS domain containing-hemolysin-like protein